MRFGAISTQLRGILWLKNNTEACRRYTQQLFQKGWKAYQEQAEVDNPFIGYQIRIAWLRFFQYLVEQGARLPREIRHALLEEAEKPTSKKWNSVHRKESRTYLISILASDQGLKKKEFKRLMALQPESHAVEPMLRCRWSTYKDHVDIIKRIGSIGDASWSTFLRRNPNIGPEWLSFILDVEGNPSAVLLEMIARHPKADESIWIKMLEEHFSWWVIDILVEIPKALASKKVRALLSEKKLNRDLVRRILLASETTEEWGGAIPKNRNQ